jgi:hypothetical protein
MMAPIFLGRGAMPSALVRDLELHHLYRASVPTASGPLFDGQAVTKAPVS